MAIYDYTGVELFSADSYEGTSLEQAYDYLGNEVFVQDPSWSLRVMSYNVQKWIGINSQQEMQNLIVSRNNPDIIALQELGTSQTLPPIAVNMLSEYDHIYQSTHVNIVGIASKLQINNVTARDYTNQDPEDISRYNETRAYLKGYLTMKGKRVCFINTHLCYLTASVKWQQMMELFAIVQDEDYCIITGDFNNMALSVTEDDYIEMFKPFVDAGYKLANCSPSVGFTKTYGNVSYATSLSDLTTAPDTIIVSPNLSISNVVVDTTKFEYLNGTVIDHVPITCDVSYDGGN